MPTMVNEEYYHHRGSSFAHMVNDVIKGQRLEVGTVAPLLVKDNYLPIYDVTTP
jgi:hypothetical protein